MNEIIEESFMDSSFWSRLLDKPDILGVMIPILGIIAFLIIIIVKKVFAHRERMAMIERGIHPDSVKKNEPA